MNSKTVISINQQTDLILKFRAEYLNARLGEMPTIDKIAENFGFAQDDAIVEKIKIVYLKEGWQQLRDYKLKQKYQPTKVELKLAFQQRAIELASLIESRIKVTSRLDGQYLTKGKVTTLDGSIELIDYQYDPRHISILILALNEIYRGISLQQNLIDQIEENPATSMSPIIMRQIMNLEQMTPEQIRSEVGKIELLMSQLNEESMENELEIRTQQGLR